MELYLEIVREIRLNEFFTQLEAKIRRLLKEQNRQTICARFDHTDVVQEVNIQVWKMAQQNESVSHFLDTAFLRTVTTGHFFKLQRFNLAKKRSVSREENVHIDKKSSDYTAEQIVELTEQSDRLAVCLGKENEEAQQIVIMHCIHGLSYRAIGRELGVSAHFVQSVHKETIERIRSAMQRKASPQ